MDTPSLVRSTFTPPEPESFFAAQRRHRRAARRLAAQAGLAAVAQSLLAALMFSPFTALVLLVGVDLVNLAHPVPDPFAAMLDGPGVTTVIVVAGAVIGTGMAWLSLLWFLLARSMHAGLAGAVLGRGHRAPDHADGEDHQLANVVEELAVAAGIATPRLLLVPGEGANVAAFGRSADDATLVVPAALLQRADRRVTTGLVADQIASIANGDLLIHRTVLALPVAWAIPQQAMSHPFAATTWRMWGGLIRLFRRRLSAEQESAFIADLLTRDEQDDYAYQRGLGKITQAIPSLVVVSWISMRVLADFIVVGPLTGVWVRRRCYLADAMAVQLTRDAAGLARGLVQLVDGGGALIGSESISMTCIVRPATPGERRRRAATEERARRGQTRPSTVEFIEDLGNAVADGVTAGLNERIAGDPNQTPEARARAGAELDAAGRRPVFRTGRNWHPATVRRLTRLEAMGWIPTDPEREWARTVLRFAEPKGRPESGRGRAARVVLWAVASPVLLFLVAPFVLTIVAGLVLLSLLPIAVFYAWPMMFVMAVVDGLLRGLAQ